MPQTHSEFYDELMPADSTVLDRGKLTEKISDAALSQCTDGTGFYDKMADFFREYSDAQFDIVSKIDDKGVWVRDATASKALDERMDHNSPVIEANNAILRGLSRFRAIDHAIQVKHKDTQLNVTALRLGLKSQFKVLVEQTLAVLHTELNKESCLKIIKNYEKGFDTGLIKALYDANLTKGVTSTEDAEKLLFHYRNLSSVLVPARTMVTLTYDEKAKVLQKETQYPVTTKTLVQKTAIDELNMIVANHLSVDMTAHTSANIATQEADKLFVDLIQSHDRALPAQTRKTHLVGSKNAFIVQVELIFDVEQADIKDKIPTNATLANTVWLARTGVPVYVGKGENSERIQIHTRENLEQIRSTALEKMRERGMQVEDSLALHLTTLNTHSFLQKQSIMVNHLYDATRRNSENQDDISYAPTNDDGTFRVLDIAPELFHEGETRPWGSSPLNKAGRVESVAEIMLKACRKPGTLSLVNCASGQDRTGTAVEKTIQMWMQARYQMQDESVDITNIETVRAKGGNAAEITSHHVHGSPGMKYDSRPGNLFDKRASKELYRASASTNKKNPIGNVDFLKHSNALTLDEFKANSLQFREILDAFEPEEGSQCQTLFKEAGVDLYKKIGVMSGIDEAALKGLDAKNIAILNDILINAIKLVEDPEDTSVARHLTVLSQVASGKTSGKWTALGATLLMFTCLALVIVGVMAAIPSGGSSLLLAAVGAVGLTVGGVVGIASATVVTGAVGGAALYKGKEKGLAKSITRFNHLYVDVKEDEGNAHVPGNTHSSSSNA